MGVSWCDRSNPPVLIPLSTTCITTHADPPLIFYQICNPFPAIWHIFPQSLATLRHFFSFNNYFQILWGLEIAKSILFIRLFPVCAYKGSRQFSTAVNCSVLQWKGLSVIARPVLFFNPDFFLLFHYFHDYDIRICNFVVFFFETLCWRFYWMLKEL